MTAEIVELSAYRPCRAAIGPNTIQGRRLPQEELTTNELNELAKIFPQTHGANNTRQALFTEAMEQAHIEMYGGPIDTSSMPSIPLPINPQEADMVIKVRQLRLMVERTAQILREYLDAYRKVQSHGR